MTEDELQSLLRLSTKSKQQLRQLDEVLLNTKEGKIYAGIDDDEPMTLLDIMEEVDTARKHLHTFKLDAYEAVGYTEDTKTLDMIEQLLVQADLLSNRIKQ